MIGAIPRRADARDVLLYKNKNAGKGIGRIGTSSLRRRAQSLAIWPQAEVLDLRGNLDTRIRKLQAGNFEAILVAAAGLKRLKMNTKGLKKKLLPLKLMLPAPGQGALAIECRRDDSKVLTLLQMLNHRPTEIAVRAERALLSGLGGGCLLPIGAFGRISDGKLKLFGIVSEINGGKAVRAQIAGNKAFPEQLGQNLARKLIKMGAMKILNAKG